MPTAIDKEIERIAQMMDTTPDVVRSSVADKQKELGCNEITALGIVKKENKWLMRRVKGTYRVFPLHVGEPRSQELSGKEVDGTHTKSEMHSVSDVIGIIYGITERGGKPHPFLSQMSLWDEQADKVDMLRGESGPFAFKGSVDTVKGKVYMDKDAEFIHDSGEKMPQFSQLMAELKQTTVPLASLMEMDADGNLIYHENNLAVIGQIVGVDQLESGRYVLEITDIGAEVITVWPPDTLEFGASNVGQEVLVYGWYKCNDKGPAISGKAMMVIPSE